jgi:hypothetical protein
MTRQISEILEDFIKIHGKDDVSVHEMTTIFGQRGFGLLLLVFALICAIPLPIPGIHMILSLPLFYITTQQMLGRREVWFPEKIRDYKIPQKAFTEISGQAIPWIQKIENFFKPRLQFICHGVFYRVTGLMAFLITAFLSIPLPLTNLIPAIALCIIAIGLLIEDGLAVLIGTLIGILWSALWMLIGFTALILFAKNVASLLF